MSSFSVKSPFSTTQTTRSPQNQISDLAVLNYPAPLAQNDKELCRSQKQKLFKAESCARHLYLGNSNDLKIETSSQLKISEIENFLRRKSSGRSWKHRGEAAYGYLLSFACGLQSKRRGESHNISLLKAASKKQEVATSYDMRFVRKVLQAVFSDAKLIRNQILDPVNMPTMTAAALSLSQTDADSDVYIVPDKMNLTKSVLVALKQRGKKAPRSIQFVALEDKHHDFFNAVASELSKIKGHSALHKITGESMPKSPVSYTHLTLPTNREV